MARGGYRPGAGRKKDTKEKQTLIKEQALLRIRELVVNDIDGIILPLIEKAKTGDVPAINELFDRAFGKAPQTIEGANGGAIVIQFDAVFKDKETT